MTARPPLPDFMILGAAKSGTNTLYHHLGRHPDLYLSVNKESVFFEAEYDLGMDYYVRTYFRGWNGERHCGEARAAHLFLPYVVPRIKDSLPDARFIVILRNPVSRAFSHWWMRYSRGVERLGFPDAIEESLRTVPDRAELNGPDGPALWRRSLRPGLERHTTYSMMRIYVDCGYYAIQLRRYFDVFARDRFMIVFFDDFVRDGASVLRAMFEFLGVSDRTEPLTPRNRAFTTAAVPLLRLDRVLGLSRIVPLRAQAVLRRMLDRMGEVPEIDAPTEARLIEHYAPHNEALSSLLSRDLSHWNRAKHR